MDASERRRLLALLERDGDVAEMMALDKKSVDTWARTGKGLSRLQVRQLRYFADGAERRQALLASGLPVCEWAESFQFPKREGLDAVEKAAATLRAHQESCSTCQHRISFLNERFGKPKRMPLGAFGSLVQTVAQVVLRVPSVLRPAAVGAFIIGGIVVLRLLFALPFVFSRGAPSIGAAGEVLVALGAAMAAGASGGIVFSIVRPLAVRLGRPGDYVTGVCILAGYMGALALLGPYAFGEEVIDLSDRVDVVAFSTITVFFGLVVGHSWPKSNTADGQRDVP